MYDGAPIGYKCLSHSAQSVALFFMNHRANNNILEGLLVNLKEKSYLCSQNQIEQ